MATNGTVSNRYDFLYLFDCKDGNPNGDPDFANAPRFDPETFQGLVSDVCLKRKIRNYVAAAKNSAEGQDRRQDKKEIPLGYEIYVKERGILAHEQRRAFKVVGAEPSESPNLEARSWMCRNFFDVRAFGAVMTTGKVDDDSVAKKEGKKRWNCGQVRGAVQITFGRSIDRIFSTEHSITRVALTNAGDTGRESVVDERGEEKAGSGQFGNKHTVAYGVYQTYGFVNPMLASDTGFNEDDLALVWKSLINMFDIDHSAARGLMTCRGLYVFKHASALGEAPAQGLFDRIQIRRKKVDIEAPRSFSDYEVLVNDKDLPKGVQLIRMVG